MTSAPAAAASASTTPTETSCRPPACHGDPPLASATSDTSRSPTAVAAIASTSFRGLAGTARSSSIGFAEFECPPHDQISGSNPLVAFDSHDSAGSASDQERAALVSDRAARYHRHDQGSSFGRSKAPRSLARFEVRLGCCALPPNTPRLRGRHKGGAMKRFVLALLLIAVFALGLGSALAAPPTVTEDTVEFVLSAATCPNLPSGTVITGTGTIKSIESAITNADGATTVINTTHAHGTATDQDGNTYRFNYSNHFQISNTGPTDPVLSGVMVDSFSLAGKGPAQLNNGFLAEFTLDFSTGVPVASFVELSSRGDPINFTTGQALCDPL